MDIQCFYLIFNVANPSKKNLACSGPKIINKNIGTSMKCKPTAHPLGQARGPGPPMGAVSLHCMDFLVLLMIWEPEQVRFAFTKKYGAQPRPI